MCDRQHGADKNCGRGLDRTCMGMQIFRDRPVSSSANSEGYGARALLRTHGMAVGELGPAFHDGRLLSTMRRSMSPPRPGAGLRIIALRANF